MTVLFQNDDLAAATRGVCNFILHNHVETLPERNLVTSEPVVLDFHEERTPWTIFTDNHLNTQYFTIAHMLWTLAGRSDVNFLSFYDEAVVDIAGKNDVIPNAAGAVLRDYPLFYQIDGHYERDTIDQIIIAIDKLKKSPDDTNAVLSLWDASCDLKTGREFFTCATFYQLQVRNGFLDMSTHCRGCDAVIGLPASYTFDYFLQALIAGSLDLKIGTYTAFHQRLSLSKTLYPDLLPHIKQLSTDLTVSPSHEVIDRRISQKQLNTFSSLFFPIEQNFRQNSSQLTLDSVKVLSMKMIVDGVPEYWVKTIMPVLLAWHARRAGNEELHDQLLSDAEADVQNLISGYKKEVA